MLQTERVVSCIFTYVPPIKKKNLLVAQYATDQSSGGYLLAPRARFPSRGVSVVSVMNKVALGEVLSQHSTVNISRLVCITHSRIIRKTMELLQDYTVKLITQTQLHFATRKVYRWHCIV